jgi:hypothetical protein
MGTRTPTRALFADHLLTAFFGYARCQELVSVSYLMPLLFLGGLALHRLPHPFPLPRICNYFVHVVSRWRSVFRSIISGHKVTAICSVALSSLRRYGSYAKDLDFL